MPDRNPESQGHTLPELLAVFGIAAIIAGSAVPAFRNLVQDSRRNAAITTTLRAVNLARQLAAIRGEPIRLCGTRDQQECSGRTDWSTGLLVADEGNTLWRSLPFTNRARAPEIRANRAAVSFEGGSGYASPATLTVCDRRGSHAARAIIISRSGRPRISDRDASDRPLAC
ncbi:MAG: GspH/FimT family pseudopilin [Steroidobacteraceae bacterium]